VRLAGPSTSFRRDAGSPRRMPHNDPVPSPTQPSGPPPAQSGQTGTSVARPPPTLIAPPELSTACEEGHSCSPPQRAVVNSARTQCGNMITHRFRSPPLGWSDGYKWRPATGPGRTSLTRPASPPGQPSLPRTASPTGRPSLTRAASPARARNARGPERKAEVDALRRIALCLLLGYRAKSR
jgi:hypothetical protein